MPDPAALSGSGATGKPHHAPCRRRLFLAARATRARLTPRSAFVPTLSRHAALSIEGNTMHRTLALILALAATPAAAADLPPAPPAGAPLAERLYIVTPAPAEDDLALLAARIACVAFQRDRIAQLLDAGLLDHGWNGDVNRLWRLSEALDRFEAVHIRPHVDTETQEMVREAYAPVIAEADSAHQCTGFGNSYALYAVSG
jgi:hypothetical protein